MENTKDVRFKLHQAKGLVSRLLDELESCSFWIEYPEDNRSPGCLDRADALVSEISRAIHSLQDRS